MTGTDATYTLSATADCTTCDLPWTSWNQTHRLYRATSPDCPDCIQAGIDDDKRHERTEDQ